jgi:hypothetical protein
MFHAYNTSGKPEIISQGGATTTRDNKDSFKADAKRLRGFFLEDK